MTIATTMDRNVGLTQKNVGSTQKNILTKLIAYSILLNVPVRRTQLYATRASGSAVEHLLAKERVAGPIPVSRLKKVRGHPNGCPLTFFESNPGLEVRLSTLRFGLRIA